MLHNDAVRLIKNTFESAYDEEKFVRLINELFSNTEHRGNVYSGSLIPNAYKDFIKSYKYICKYVTPSGEELSVLSVNLTKNSTLEKARTAQRNFIANYMKERGKNACLVAFYTDEDNKQHWRFSFVRTDTSFDLETFKLQSTITPAKRYSYMVGDRESSHTAQQQLCQLLESPIKTPELDDIEGAFAVEKVSSDFFDHYKELFLQLVENIQKIIDKDSRIKFEFVNKNISAELFCKKLMGQIVFLYFIQKKGWLGVAKDAYWGTGDRHFMRTLFETAKTQGKNYFNDFLEPLFYEALASERKTDGYFDKLGCRIPFLNGGLFEPISGYNWQATDIVLDNDIFSNKDEDGILDVFDRYNFTVREDEPLEKEIAVDPEMLGKVFENLLEIKDRKSKGAFYTPREIVHYMCQQSLIQYLNTKMDGKVDISDIEFLVRYGDVYSELQDKVSDIKSYETKVPEQLVRIKPYAEQIDNALAEVKVFDPAIGSGAFPVGMMHEIIRTRQTLLDSGFIKADKKHTIYEYKRQIIRDSIYGVDIEESAVEIAKLRLWLSLVVDEDNVTNIKPLPNLDYKIVCGNSLKDVHNLFGESVRKELADLQSKQFDSFGSEKAKYTKQINNIYEKIFKANEFDFKLYFPKVFDNEGFDIVIANPPYIGEKGNKKIFEEARQYSIGKKFYMGKMDYLYFFFHLALNVVKNNGIVSFITTNYYITADGAKKLRTDFKLRANLLYMINFNELKIFESALGQHNMITILQKGFDEHKTCKICITSHKNIATPDLLQRILYNNDKQTVYSKSSQLELYDGPNNYIRLQQNTGSKFVDIILNKIHKDSTPLKEVCNINQGVVSGCDSVDKNHLQKTSKPVKVGEGIFVLDLMKTDDKNIFNELMTEVPNVLKPFYKNSDIYPYICSEKPKKYLIYLRKGALNITNYPILQKHIEKYSDIIQKSSSNAPFLHRPRIENIFTSHKIVVPYRSPLNTFGYNDVDWFCRSDCYVITQKSLRYDLKYILGILNSKVYYYWLYYKGKRKGEILELFQKPLSEIPIKYTDNQDVFVELVNTLIDKKKNREKTSSEEEQLNQMIYKLYDLTPEEIAEVEKLYPSTKGSKDE